MQILLFIENYGGNVSDVESHLKTKIPEYMVPSYITNIPYFPLNANGKINRKELAKMGQDLQLQYN
jgi:acyl-CoA synthetase (AMP-forming)/AMP-acid ligase II